jgi:ABC-type uncharacterized transport system permease subunit
MNFIKYVIENFKIHVAENLEYKFSTVVFVFMQTIISWMSLIITYSIYELTSQGIPGWGFHEIILMIGLNYFIIGVYELTFKLRKLRNLIRRGNFDNMLTRPIHPLLYFLNIDYYQIGMLLSSIILLIYAVPNVNLVISINNLLLFAASIIMGYVALFSTELIIHSTAFFTTVNFTIEYNLDNIRRNFSKWPMSIYPSKLQWFFIIFFSLPFFGFIPASLILGKELSSIYLFSPIGVLLLLIISIQFFKYGMQNYSGTGS